MESLTNEELNNLRDELLFQLFKDAEIPFDNNLTDEQKQNFLYALIVMRHAEQPDEKLLNLQNKYLTAINKKSQIDINNLKFKNNFCFLNENLKNCTNFAKENENLNNENILNVNADLLLIITDTLLEDAEALSNNKHSLDNELLFKAGIEYKYNVLKNYLGKIDEPIIENGYCLPAKYVAKIIYSENLINEIFKNNLNDNLENNKNLNNFYFNLKNNKNIKKDANFIKFFNNLTYKLNILFNFINKNSIKSVAIYIKENPLKAEIINLIKTFNKKAKIKIVLK